MEFQIRDATPSDNPAILSIVNHAILNTTAIYDYDPRTPEMQQQWFDTKMAAGDPVIVAEFNSEVVGFGTFSQFRPKKGYSHTVEHSVYVSSEFSGKGAGKLIVRRLIEIAKTRDHHIMIGVIDAANSGSIEFHKKNGFTECGIIREAGYKFGRWLDVLIMQLKLS
ncbi:MAG: N-acetyltransferase family protein [Flavobacterium sp.]|nr:MAG: N-acetyltransferase family protein [Flavobacterium sp.]